MPKRVPHFTISHLITFDPSSGCMGIMLNITKNMFIVASSMNKSFKLLGIILITTNRIANPKFVNGPAMLISPFSRVVTDPVIYTAPGAANRNPMTEVAMDRSKKNILLLNSA